MSAIRGGWEHTARSVRPGRPGYLALLSAMFGAQVVCALMLWVADIGLAIVRIAPGGGRADPFLPWQLDGPWSIVGAAGWAYLVSWLVADQFVGRLIRREWSAPSTGWSAIGVAVGGYGALALGHTTGARILLAVAVTPLIVSALAYTSDGRPRPWPAAVGRRTRLGLGVIALLLSLAYLVPHPFTASGSGGSYTSGVNRLAFGQTVDLDIGLSGHLLPTQLIGVTLGQAELVRSATLSAAPATPGGNRLPTHLAADGQWIDLRVGLACPASPTTISHATLHYRVLGLTTSQRIPLGESVRLACRR